MPNFVSLPARLQVFFGKVPENSTPRDGHIYWTTYCGILNLLSRSSFEVEYVVSNTFWQDVPVVALFIRILKNIFPSIFALSFVIKAKKI